MENQTMEKETVNNGRPYSVPFEVDYLIDKIIRLDRQLAVGDDGQRRIDGQQWAQLVFVAKGARRKI